MDVREELVELLGKLMDFGHGTLYTMADYLIANGVTVSEEALPVAEAATERSAAVDKIEDQHKPEDFIGHRKPEQEWISVKDRLPEDMVDVLTCDAKGNIHVMWHHHDFMHPFNVGRNDLRYYPVTHWMPLPQPPKGE